MVAVYVDSQMLCSSVMSVLLNIPMPCLSAMQTQSQFFLVTPQYDILIPVTFLRLLARRAHWLCVRMYCVTSDRGSCFYSLQQDCPNGRLTPAKFVDMYKMFFPSGNAEEFCDHVFRTFDMDKNGYIDFKVSSFYRVIEKDGRDLKPL